ncbi:MAG: Gldg family protein [Akkermansiaceae bacterium]
MPEKEPSTESPPRPVSRVGRSINVVIQVTCFVVVVIAANYLSCARHERFDLTERKNFTLSNTTEQYLKSDALQSREAPLKVLAIMRRSSPHFTRIFNLLEEYKRIGGDKIELEVIDPILQTDRTLEIENIYKQPYTEDMLIVDGRKIESSPATTGDTPPSSEKTNPPPTETTAENPGTNNQQELSAHVRAQRISNLYLQDNRGNITAWQDEDIITSSIIGAIEGIPRRIYFAADKVNLEADKGGDPAWQNLAGLLWQQNILLTPLRLAETSSIPEDAEGFALIGPQYDLNEKEIKVLSEYWDRQKSSLLITLDPSTELPNLKIFLRSYGITPRKDRIMTVQNGEVLSNVSAVFSRGSEITESLGGKSTVFDGSTSSLEVDENNDSLINRRIRPLSLIQSVSGWWGETRFDQKEIKFNEEEDEATPLHLAAAVLRGKATSDETADLVSKMVVIANTDFLATKKTRSEQSDFIKSSVNWLVGRENLIGIGPQKLHRHKITLLDSHDSFIRQLILIYLPLASLLTAMIIWNVRRS